MSRVRLMDLFQVCDDNAGEAFLKRLKNSRKPDEKLYYLKHKFLNASHFCGFLVVDNSGEFHLSACFELPCELCKFRSLDIKDIENRGFDLSNFEKVEVKDE